MWLCNYIDQCQHPSEVNRQLLSPIGTRSFGNCFSKLSSRGQLLERFYVQTIQITFSIHRRIILRCRPKVFDQLDVVLRDAIHVAHGTLAILVQMQYVSVLIDAASPSPVRWSIRAPGRMNINWNCSTTVLNRMHTTNGKQLNRFPVRTIKMWSKMKWPKLNSSDLFTSRYIFLSVDDEYIHRLLSAISGKYSVRNSVILSRNTHVFGRRWLSIDTRSMRCNVFVLSVRFELQWDDTIAWTNSMFVVLQFTAENRHNQWENSNWGSCTRYRIKG